MALPLVGISLYAVSNLSLEVPGIVPIVAGTLLMGAGFGYFWGTRTEAFDRIESGRSGKVSDLDGNGAGELMSLLQDKSQLVADRYNLSKREAEVLPYILEGRSARVIANKLFISENTVRSHIRHILEKVGIRSKAELVDIIGELDEARPQNSILYG